MKSEIRKHSRRMNWESVHICEKCGHRLNLADIDLMANHVRNCGMSEMRVVGANNDSDH